MEQHAYPIVLRRFLDSDVIHNEGIYNTVMNIITEAENTDDLVNNLQVEADVIATDLDYMLTLISDLEDDE